MSTSEATNETNSETTAETLLPEGIDAAVDGEADADPKATSDAAGSDATPEAPAAESLAPPGTDLTQRPELVLRDVGDEDAIRANIAALEHEINLIGDPDAERIKCGQALSRRKLELKQLVESEERAIGDLTSQHEHLKNEGDRKHRALNALRDQLESARSLLAGVGVARAENARKVADATDRAARAARA